MTITVGGSNITFPDATTLATSAGIIPGVLGQVFTSSGTFTIPTGVTALKITVVGGGGGAGNSGWNGRGMSTTFQMSGTYAFYEGSPSHMSFSIRSIREFTAGNPIGGAGFYNWIFCNNDIPSEFLFNFKNCADIHSVKEN